MVAFTCKMCGAPLTPSDRRVIRCEYCGAFQTVARTRDELVTNLFNRANDLRMNYEYDRAAQAYERILEQDYTEAEAHWGIVLCRYGIEYVNDPQTGKMIPTCRRTLFEAITSDADYLAAVKYADDEQRAVYIRDARIIDGLQKSILGIVNSEKPYDVFICYKETDEAGQRTVDSVLAYDIYQQLTREGLRVFYAPVSLEDKLGRTYEPYIFSALFSAKVMLALATKPSYINAVWVKNEWSRFLAFAKKDPNKVLIPCYRDMNVYDLPDAFAHLQAQDMGKLGFMQDLVRGVKKILQPAPRPEAVQPPRPAPAPQPTQSRQPSVNVPQQAGTPKDKWLSFLLCFFAGFFGAHKFYEGRIGMGLLYLFTGGLFGIGWLVDCVVLLCKPNPYYV